MESGLQGGMESTCNKAERSSIPPVVDDPEKTLEFAEKLMIRGSKATKEQDHNEAADCFSRALEIRVGHFGELAPECMDAYYRYGCALIYKDPVKAVSFCRKALQLATCSTLKADIKADMEDKVVGLERRISRARYIASKSKMHADIMNVFKSCELNGLKVQEQRYLLYNYKRELRNGKSSKPWILEERVAAVRNNMKYWLEEQFKDIRYLAMEMSEYKETWLQNENPVSCSELELDLSKKDVKLKGKNDFLRWEGSRPEVYSEEHEKLLGSTEMSCTLFVDGYGKDGKQIYDPLTGKTCHQCRQKTLGHCTHCSECGMVQGQFCGDCLYMRYGEHVLEANQNPNWICPVCRGICNCSLCRQSKGWPPTGPLYRKISILGYKSVAHYLIQTRRGETVTEIAVSPSSKISHEPEDKKDCISPHLADQHFNSSLEPESSPKPRETSVDTAEPAGGSIAGRLKKRLLSRDIFLEANESIGTKDITAHAKAELENVSFQDSVDTSVDIGQDSVDYSGRLKQSPSGDICPEADESIGTKDIPVHAKVELENVSFQVSVDTSIDVGQATVDNSGRLKCMGTEEIGKERQLSAERKNGTLGFRQKKKPTIASFPGKLEANNGTCSSPLLKRKSSIITEAVNPDSVAERLGQRRCRSRGCNEKRSSKTI